MGVKAIPLARTILNRYSGARIVGSPVSGENTPDAARVGQMLLTVGPDGPESPRQLSDAPSSGRNPPGVAGCAGQTLQFPDLRDQSARLICRKGDPLRTFLRHLLGRGPAASRAASTGVVVAVADVSWRSRYRSRHSSYLTLRVRHPAWPHRLHPVVGLSPHSPFNPSLFSAHQERSNVSRRGRRLSSCSGPALAERTRLEQRCFSRLAQGAVGL